MSFDWRGYLEFAEKAYDTVSVFPNPEAVYRCVASRAYYAVFCLARDLIKQKDGMVFTVNVHKELQMYLKAHRHQTRARLGVRLENLHQLRLNADYDGILKQEAQYLAGAALKMAKRIEDDLAEIRGSRSK